MTASWSLVSLSSLFHGVEAVGVTGGVVVPPHDFTEVVDPVGVPIAAEKKTTIFTETFVQRDDNAAANNWKMSRRPGLNSRREASAGGGKDPGQDDRIKPEVRCESASHR